MIDPNRPTGNMNQFDLQPVLEGERVYLRPLKTTDWSELFAVASDPLLWAQHPAFDRHQEAVFRRFFDDALASGGALVVVAKPGGGLIGSSRYNSCAETPDRVEIGWTFLSRAHWGGGYNREIKTLMLRHAFRFVETVYFRVGETNFRSRQAMEKIGGILTDQRETILLPDGRPIVHVIYEIRRDSFLSQESGAVHVTPH